MSSRIKTILGLITVTAVSGFLFFWFGMFNVAATDKHWAITTAFLEWVRERSISSNVEDLKVPNLTDEKLIASGAPNYAAMCAQCHLSPGVATSEFYEGLNPQPPVFHKGETHDRNPVAAFWIISNGIKMTGMASWGSSHTRAQIWEIISFINVMPGMTADTYKKMVGDGKHSHKGGGGENHGEGTGKPTLTVGHHGAATTTKANSGAAQNSDHHAAAGQSQADAIQQAQIPTTSSAEQNPHSHGGTPAAMQQQTPIPTTSSAEQNPHSHGGEPAAMQQQAPIPTTSSLEQNPHSHGDAPAAMQQQTPIPTTSSLEQNPHSHGGGKSTAIQQPTATKTSSAEQSGHSHGGAGESITTQQRSFQSTPSSESSLYNNDDEYQHSHNTDYNNNHNSQYQYNNGHNNQYQNDSGHSHQQYYYDNYGHSNANH